MGKSKDQRKVEKIEFSEFPPVAVGFIEQLIQKNNKYIAVPQTAEMTENLSNWMSFEKDIYYPLGGLDSSKQPCKMLDVMVMTVEWMSPTKELQQAEFSCTPQSNLYWFRAIRFNAPGTVTVTFSIPNQKGENRIKPKQIKVRVHRSPGLLPTLIKKDSEALSTKEKKRTAPSGSSLSRKNKVENSMSRADVTQQAISSSIGTGHDADSSASACVLLTRPWIEPVTVTSHFKDSPYLVLSSALRGALLDDKWRHMSPSIGNTDPQRQSDYARPQRTVYQILHSRDIFHRRIGVKMWNKLIGLANTLLLCFESLFLDFVLYPHEKDKLIQSGVLHRLRQGQIIGANADTSTAAAGREDPLWETTKSCMYHHFGAIHLLRFLVILLLKLNEETDSISGDNCSSSLGNSKKKRKTSVGDDDNECNSASKGKRGTDDSASLLSSKSGCSKEEVYDFARGILELLETPEYFPYLRT